MDQYSEPSPEQNQESTLFGFGIDQSSKAHLWEAAKWAKFLAIMGFIMCGLAILFGIFMGTIYSSIMRNYDDYGGASAYADGMGVFMIIVYVAIAVIYFFPCLFLLRFANHMKNALNTDDQGTLNTSFQNLKIMFRYVGIVTIIFISLYILFILYMLLIAVSV